MSRRTDSNDSKPVCRRRPASQTNSKMMVFIMSLLCFSHFMGCADSFFLGMPGKAVENTKPQSIPPPSSDAVGTQKGGIRIRKTVQSDLNAVAQMLSTASMSSQEENNGPFNWKNQINQKIAQADIGALLKNRLEALDEGRRRMEQINNIAQYRDLSDSDRLKVLWATSEKLRTVISKASVETGENNLWKEHNFALTPPNQNWLYHLQITAEEAATGKVVGFCEVAMLSNPLVEEELMNGNVEDDEDGRFSPAITNLATSPGFRRRGIATKMLLLAQRYVQRYWKYDQLGLYVEQKNEAALALYKSLGYTEEAQCDGGDVLGDLWYMVLDMSTRQETETEILAESTTSSV